MFQEVDFGPLVYRDISFFSLVLCSEVDDRFEATHTLQEECK